jgi:hypothetical protein
MAPRLTTTALAIAGAALLGLAATVAATDPTSVAANVGPRGWQIAAGLALAGTALLALGLALASSYPILPALALLGAAWLVALPTGGPWRPATAFAGGWLLAVAELAYWSLDLEIATVTDSEVFRRRALTIGTLAAGASLLALVPELGFSPVPVAGLELTGFGLLAAAALLAVAALLAWNLRSSRSARGSDEHAPADRG